MDPFVYRLNSPYSVELVPRRIGSRGDGRRSDEGPAAVRRLRAGRAGRLARGVRRARQAGARRVRRARARQLRRAAAQGDRPTDRLAEKLADWPTNWPTGRQTGRLAAARHYYDHRPTE